MPVTSWDGNNTLIGFDDTPAIDAIGRLRVSELNAIESLHFTNTSHPLLTASSLTGGGTATYTRANSSVRLATTTGATDNVVFQTRRYFRYNPGQSYVMTASGSLGAKKANVRQRLGYFDALNGLFFEQDSSNLKVVYRTDSTGSAVDTAVNQSSWNTDKLNGTGPSGVTIDPSKHILYIIDFLWHGAGRVRWGAVIGGKIIYCHQIDFGNVDTKPYMRTPSLPVRAELSNTAGTASGTTMDVVCFSYSKESLDNLIAPYGFSASTGRTSDSASATRIPILSIRPKATFNGNTNRIPIVPRSISASTRNEIVLFDLVLNPTLTGAVYVSADTNSAVEYDLTATAMSGGTTVKQFYLATGNTLLAQGLDLRELVLNLDVAGTTADIFTLAATSTSGGTSVFGQMDWEEYQ